jgi:chromate transporter
MSGSLGEKECSPLRELAVLFLRLGFTAFGGPAAHIAMMEDEVVRRRGWLSQVEFLDLLGATNLIPGPNSTEMAIHIGYRRGRWRGLLLAGACFILPAAFLVAALAWAYVKYGKLPEAAALLYGIKPVIIAIVFQALWRLGQTALKTRTLVVAAILCSVLNFCGVNELGVLFGAGIIISIFRYFSEKGKQGAAVPLLGVAVPLVPLWAAASSAGVASFNLSALFFFFLKVGSVLFGSGYVLLAFLRADLVQRWGWLTESQLLDAIAVGQITPGPVFTTATFIGYLLGGGTGAVVATIGIFLPAFVFVAISSPFVPRIRNSPVASAFLDGVNVASLALMGVVTVQLARAALVDWVTGLLAVLAGVLLVRFKLNSLWLVGIGAVAGLLKFLF